MSSLRKMAVVGYPVGHSKSPLIHAYWLDRYGVAGSYSAVALSPDEFETGLRALIADGYSGFNVTVPHKEAALRLCDEVDDAARAIGAVNTIGVDGDRIYGFNTDAYGFMENLRRGVPDYAASGRAVILGAGGAARAVAHGLMKDGWTDIVVTNRTDAKAAAVAALSPDIVRTRPWDERVETLRDAALLVNTTSLGMVGMDPLDLSVDALPTGAIVSDIVYAPLTTPLLAAASARGNRTVTGIGMLLYQAAAAFDIWHGLMPEVTDELTAKVLAR